MRVCLDTNVLVAAFTTRGLCADVFRVVAAEHDLVVGQVMLEEMERALRTKFGMAKERIEEAVSLLNRFDVIPKPDAPSSIPMRDPADRWIVATAIAGSAAVLVTGDRDLIAIHDAAAPMSILTPREFWDQLRADPEA